MAESLTAVVELTPPGRAAVAVVVVAGPAAVRAVGECFRPARRLGLAEIPIGRIVLGRWNGPEGEEVVACRQGEDEIEVHCHGGAAAVRGVIDRLVEHGCEERTWQEWVRGSSRIDPKISSASRRGAATWEARIALAKAPTLRAAGVLLDQYHGALSRSIQAARAAIVAGDWRRAGDVVGDALRFRGVGLHLTNAWRVVIAGPPNVGKSSLMNALAGYQRAIVSPLPGTTRDVVTLTTAIDGWPVELADTAGLRGTDDELERSGVKLAGAAIAGADLVLLVADAAGALNAAAEFAAQVPSTVPVMNVWNKVDLVSTGEREKLHSSSSDPQSKIGKRQLVSALTGEEIPELVSAIGASLVPVAPPVGAAVPFTANQAAGLDAARKAIEREDADAAIAALDSFAGSNG